MSVGCLASMLQHPTKTGLMAHSCSSSTREVKTGESEVHGHSQLHSKFEPETLGQKGFYKAIQYI